MPGVSVETAVPCCDARLARLSDAVDELVIMLAAVEQRREIPMWVGTRLIDAANRVVDVVEEP